MVLTSTIHGFLVSWGAPIDFNGLALSQDDATDDHYTRLPIEFHLDVLNRLSLREADEKIRLSFPHITPQWLPSIPRRFELLFNNLTSVQSLRHIGGVTSNGDYLADIYRFHNVDYHPDIEIIPQDAELRSSAVQGAESLNDFSCGTEFFGQNGRPAGRKPPQNARATKCHCASWGKSDDCGRHPEMQPYIIALSDSDYKYSIPPGLWRRAHSIFEDLGVAMRPAMLKEIMSRRTGSWDIFAASFFDVNGQRAHEQSRENSRAGPATSSGRLL
ncbi:unnamed protein product [Diplocarpon coronariae]